MEILRDQITCLEKNLQSKRMDLEEKLQILESTQEQLAEANAKIAMLSSAPDSNGNSLKSFVIFGFIMRYTRKPFILRSKRKLVIRRS